VRRERRTLLKRLIERRTHAAERVHTCLIERRTEAAGRGRAAAPDAMRKASAARVDAHRPYPPLAQTLARAAAPTKGSVAQRDPAPARASTTTNPQRSVMRWGNAPAAPDSVTLPPDELCRVTEHVIAQLDLRIRSYRERMGFI